MSRLLTAEEYATLLRGLYVSSGDVHAVKFIPVDRSGMLSVIESTHARIHRGEYFTHSSVHSAVTAGAAVVHVIDPSSASPHFRIGQIQADAGAVLVEFYEGVQVSSLGAPDAVYNNSRNGRDAVMKLYSSAVVSSLGTMLRANLISGTNKGAAPGEFGEHEYILSRDKYYAVRTVNISAQTQMMSVDQNWYETGIPL